MSTWLGKFTTLSAARAAADAWVSMEADYGGQFLLSCPVERIKCDDSAFLRLFHDLVHITWGKGFLADAPTGGPEGDDGESIDVIAGSGPANTPDGMSKGTALNDLILHDEIEHELQLRVQIWSVLDGRQPRLNLPEGFPHCALPSLEAALMYPLGRVSICSAEAKIQLLNCAANLVRIDEPGLTRLGRALDAIREESRTLVVDRDPRITYRPREKFMEQSLWLLPGPIHRRRTEIAAVLAGERESI